jgi:hypothetical protein
VFRKSSGPAALSLASGGPKGVRFASISQQVPGVDFGLGWIRRRQRSLTRAVLALFCAAWLQAAIVPCVMAHADDTAARAEAPGMLQHDSHGGHDHAAMLAEHAAGDSTHPCLYCPPGNADADSCDGHGGCAYPHEPQVDARAAGAIFAAVPVAFVVPSPGALVVAHRADLPAPDFIPRVRLSVSYCRFIE